MNKKRKSIIGILSSLLIITVIAIVLIPIINTENKNNISIIFDIACGASSLGAALAALWISFVDREDRITEHKDKVEKEARKFILVNYDEIDYLDFAIIAKQLNYYFKYTREIYNSFFLLDEDVQTKVLKILKKDKELFMADHLDETFKKIVIFCEDFHLGLFPFSSFKELFNHMKIHGKDEFVDYTNVRNLENKYVLPKDYLVDKYGHLHCKHLSFEELLISYLNCWFSADNRWLCEKVKPIELFFSKNDVMDEDIKNTPAILHCLLEIIKIYSQQPDVSINLNLNNFSDVKIINCEDEFLRLCSILCQI